MPDAPDAVATAPEVPTTPSVLGSGNAPANVPLNTRSAPAAPSPQPPVHPAVAAEVAHSTAMGRAMKFMMGTHPEYEQTPQGPVPRDVPNKPGQLMRSILAGALTGMAAGASQPGFGRGAAAGAGASQRQSQENDDRARQQAQQQYQNEITARREKREEDSQTSEENVRKATIAMQQAQTARLVIDAQGQSYAYHRQIAEDGKAKISPYVAAHIAPQVEDIPETQVQKYVADHPGSGNWDWEPTGVKTVQNPDGSIDHHLVMSAYDPKVKVPVTKEFLKLMKDADMDKYDPNLFKVLKEGKELSPTEFSVVKGQYETASANKRAENKEKLQESEIKLHITELNKSIAKMNEDEVDKKAVKGAGEKWNKLVEGGMSSQDAFGKLAPNDQRLLSESFTPLLKNIDSAIAPLLKGVEDRTAGPAAKAELEELSQQRDSIVRLSTSSIIKPKSTTTGGDQVAVQIPGQPVGYIAADKVDEFMKKYPNAVRVGSTTSAASNPLAKIPSSDTLFQDQNGGVQQIPNDAADAFQKAHPNYKNLGVGQKPEETANSFASK